MHRPPIWPHRPVQNTISPTQHPTPVTPCPMPLETALQNLRNAPEMLLAPAITSRRHSLVPVATAAPLLLRPRSRRRDETPCNLHPLRNATALLALYIHDICIALTPTSHPILLLRIPLRPILVFFSPCTPLFIQRRRAVRRLLPRIVARAIVRCFAGAGARARWPGSVGLWCVGSRSRGSSGFRLVRGGRPLRGSGWVRHPTVVT